MAEKFTVHYDDGAMKEIGSGVIFGMDSDGHTDACYINMDAGRLVRVAVLNIFLPVKRRFVQRQDAFLLHPFL